MQSGYAGGFWNFYDLSNGCFSIAPELPHPMRLMRPGSFFDGEMSPDAFAEKYWQIYEYIGSHPEAQKIYAAVETKSPLHYT